MSKNKNSNPKLEAQKQQTDEEAVRREEELESYNLTPEEFSARLRETRCYFEKIRDGLEGVPFDALAESPGNSIRDIDYRSIRDLVEHLNPFILGWRVHCKDLEDELGFLTAGLADTGFAIGVLFGAMTHGASEAE